MKIVEIKGREILDLCGNFIVEVDVILELGIMGCVFVLLGVLIGEYEVLELCDGDKICYGGKGVLKVVENINIFIVLVLKGMDFMD